MGEHIAGLAIRTTKVRLEFFSAAGGRRICASIEYIDRGENIERAVRQHIAALAKRENLDGHYVALWTTGASGIMVRTCTPFTASVPLPEPEITF